MQAKTKKKQQQNTNFCRTKHHFLDVFVIPLGIHLDFVDVVDVVLVIICCCCSYLQFHFCFVFYFVFFFLFKMILIKDLNNEKRTKGREIQLKFLTFGQIHNKIGNNCVIFWISFAKLKYIF